MKIAFGTKISCLVLFTLSFSLYFNSLFGNFVWDDHYLIDENPKISDPASIPHFFTKDFWINSSVNFQSGFYRPVVLLSFFFNANLWDNNPLGFHLFNIVLHGFNGILVYLLFLSLGSRSLVAFLAGFFFVLHPIQTETVAFISDVGDILVVFFLLLSCRFYILSANSRSRKGNVFLSVLFLLLAMLSKENAMIGFLLIALIDWFFVSKADGKLFQKRLPALSLYVLATVAFIILRVAILGKNNAVTVLDNVRYVSILPAFDLWSHILTTIKIIALYLKLLVLPLELSIAYVVLPAVSLFSFDVFFAVILVLSLLILIFICTRENKRWIAFAFAWFFLTILPISNLIPISNTIAERFLYLPMVGYAFLLANCVNYLREWAVKRKLGWLTFYAIFSLIIIFFSYKTITRNFIWQSDYSVFASAADMRPCAPVAHRNLSAYYYRQKNIQNGLFEDEAYRSCVAYIQKEYLWLKGQVKK